jgi:Zn-dependent protease
LAILRSFNVGRIRGIDIKVHPTFALVFAWVLFQWGGVGGLEAILFGFVLMGLVFGCVVLHELGHAVMAQHFGVRVFDITLLPIGGVARVEMVPARPAAEVQIALAGPAVNVAIAVALLPPLLLLGVVRGFDVFADYLEAPTILAPGGLLLYLVLTNVLLVVFNLLPAFPMDGGRLLRAGLAHYLGRERATRIAVAVGQALALALAVLGLWAGDYGLPLIALFIVVAAWAEGRAVRVESAMRRLRVGQFALWDHGGISPWQPLTVALTGGPRDLVVTEGGRVVGMLWRHHLLTGLNGGAGDRRVADVMDSDVPTADVNDTLYDVQQRMSKANRWAVPVTESGLYRGIFTADRFLHVYRQLAAPPFRAGAATGFAGALAAAARLLAR